jgi:hypothetical protein
MHLPTAPRVTRQARCMPAMDGRTYTHMHQRTQVAPPSQGKGVAADVSAAFAWYSKAAEQVRTHTHTHTHRHTHALPSGLRTPRTHRGPWQRTVHRSRAAERGMRGVCAGSGTQPVLRRSRRCPSGSPCCGSPVVACAAVPQWQPVLRYPNGSPCCGSPVAARAAVPQWQPVPCAGRRDRSVQRGRVLRARRGRRAAPRPCHRVVRARAHAHTPPRSLLGAWHA